MDTHELAWAAGFFDGEGYTGYSARSYSLRMCVGQKDREVLDRFQAALGGIGRVYVTPKADAPYHQWYLSGQENVGRALELLRPYLGRLKTEQAERALGARVERYSNFWGEQPIRCRKGHDLTLPDAIYTHPPHMRQAGVRQCEACRQNNLARQYARRAERRKAARA